MRVAILVDGDNIGSAHAPAILETGTKIGTVDVARVYSNASGTTPWRQALGYRLIHSGTGKNSTDLLLAIEAVELAHTCAISTFVIATSDRDFTHLAHHLRGRGLTFIGVGEANTPAPFREACSSFRQLHPPRSCGKTPAATPNVSKFDLQIRETIAAGSLQGQGMALSTLNQIMLKDFGTKIGTQPGGDWRSYLSARPTLYDLDPRGPEAKVRFRPQGFSGGSTPDAPGPRPVPKITIRPSTPGPT